jgi:ribonuclease P protein component
MPDSTSKSEADDHSRRLRFRKQQHLLRPDEFERVYALKRQAGDDRLLVFAARNLLGLTRIGLSVSRKQGVAVKRQRLKRLLREAFRLTQHELPVGLDLVLIPRAGGDAGVEDYRASLRKLAEKLDRRLRREEPAPVAVPGVVAAPPSEMP